MEGTKFRSLNLKGVRNFKDLQDRLEQYSHDYFQAITEKKEASREYFQAKAEFENFSEEALMSLRIKHKGTVPKPTQADLQGRLARLPKYKTLQKKKLDLEAKYQYHIDQVFAFQHCKELTLEFARGMREKYYN